MVRARVHPRVALAGFEPTSRWATFWKAPEDFSKFAPSELSRIAEANDRDLLDSHVVLVLARPGAGGEMFAEAKTAIDHGLAVVWSGRRTLSSWRPGVVRADCLDDAIAELHWMSDRFAAGARGRDLVLPGAAT